MKNSIENNLKKHNVILPQPPIPVAGYVPFVITGKLIFISGQVCFIGQDQSLKGKLGANLTTEQGYQAARNATLNAIAHLKSACKGDLEIVKKCVNIRVLIACTSDFIDHPKVGNGASDLISDIFGIAGPHSRAAVGCSSLPLDCAVEVESIWEIL
ncbi:MAG: hypothetical protein CL567_01325 [Alphaproteobacteria bacterium]|nr:hypothetical protein [Alphaproteobacteria bacterium]|tara:strand:+ start:193 stop:660 length:468 start_codon:yes stop_codon:yes gene_type:complete